MRQLLRRELAGRRGWPRRMSNNKDDDDEEEEEEEEKEEEEAEAPLQMRRYRS